MQTTQIVRGAAEVLTITRLRVNDVYKRVEENYSGEPVLRYGIVTDVMDNGPDAAVVATEYRPADFGAGIQIRSAVITGSRPMAIFPAEPIEVADHMDAVVAAAEDAAKAAREKYEEASAQLTKVMAVRDGLTRNALTTPETSNEPLPTESDEDEGTDEAPL